MNRDNRAFLRLIVSTETQLTVLLDQLARRLQTVLERTRRPEQVQSVVFSLVDEFMDAYRELAEDAIAGTAAQQATTNAGLLLPLLQRAGARNERRRMDRRFSGYEETIRRRFPVQKHPEDEKTFIQRVKTVREGFQKTVYGMVREGVNQGTDPRKLAYLIRDYVIATPPKSGESERFKQYAALRNRASSYVAYGAPSGSLQYNTMRIVRTEMAGIYRTSVVDFYEGRPYLEEYLWLLSNRHRKIDSCDDKASRTYRRREDIPSTHPMCLCRVVAQVMSQAAIMRLIANGELD